ncbi:MAG: hypothetical protein ACKOCT_16110 [Alphaproteobacteria bacterium]
MASRRRAGLSRATAGASGPASLLLLAVLAGLAPGCATNAVDRAIAARGGPMTASLRQVEATVHQGFPGTWTWEIALRRPDLVRWTIHTFGEEQSYAYDGRRVLLYLGSASMPVDAAAERAFLSQVRWLAVTGLDVLLDGGRVAWEEVARAEVPAGIARGLRVRWIEDGSTYLLWFDDRDLLVAAEGEVALPPIGSGRMRADFSDFGSFGGRLLPRSGRYTLGGSPLVDERVLSWTPEDPKLTDASFSAGPP